MKAKDVQIGEVYAIKVAANVTAVRITEENPFGGWNGVNINTNKPIRIRTASRIRGPWKKGGRTETHTSAHVEKKTETPAQNTTLATEPNTAKLGGLSAAVKVLQEAGEPLNCKTMIERMLQKGYWTTNGKTPEATLNAAIAREIKTKGPLSRFKKVERGLFSLTK